MATATKFSSVVNGVVVDDLANTVSAVKTHPEIAKFKFRVRNQWEGGGRNVSKADGFYGAMQELSRLKPFVLEADEPGILLGKDTAANPAEHLLHALAACLTTSMVYHAAARGIQIDEVESSLEGDIDLHGFLDLDPKVRKGFQGIRVNFKVKANASDEQLQEIAQLGPKYSPVMDTITKGVQVKVTAARL